MGTKHPDRISMEEWRVGHESVADMLRGGWDVQSHCPTCGLVMRVDFGVVAKVSGPATSLWNRKQHCRRVGCSGFAHFEGRPPGAMRHRPLTSPWPAGVRPKRVTEGERARPRDDGAT